MVKKKMKCPYCGGTHLWKVGPRISISKGKQVRYQCQDCAHTFYESSVKRVRKAQRGE